MNYAENFKNLVESYRIDAYKGNIKDVNFYPTSTIEFAICSNQKILDKTLFSDRVKVKIFDNDYPEDEILLITENKLIVVRITI